MMNSFCELSAANLELKFDEIWKINTSHGEEDRRDIIPHLKQLKLEILENAAVRSSGTL